MWWKLKNTQLGKVMVLPEQKITKPVAVTKPAPSAAPSSSSVGSSSVNSPSVNSSSTTPDAQTNAAPESASASLPSQEPSKLPRITGIRHWSSADSSTVVLDLEDQVQYEAHRLTSPDRIYFDVHDTSLAPEIEGKAIDVGDALLARVRVSQPVSGLTRVVLETKDKPNFSVSLEPNPYRLVVRVRRLGADPKAQVNLFREPRTRHGRSWPSWFLRPRAKICNCGGGCRRCASWWMRDTEAGIWERSAGKDCWKKMWCSRLPKD